MEIIYYIQSGVISHRVIVRESVQKIARDVHEIKVRLILVMHFLLMSRDVGV